MTLTIKPFNFPKSLFLVMEMWRAFAKLELTFLNIIGISCLEKLTCTSSVNRLTPNDPYMDRTAPLTSKRCILYIYSTNIGTEYLNML